MHDQPNRPVTGWHLSALPPAERVEAIEHALAELIDLRHAALREMPYDEYLLTEHWQDTRRHMLRLADGRCQVCNMAPSLDDELGRVMHVHHRTYERRGQERPADLVVLCEDCHGLFHANRVLSEVDVVHFEPDMST